MRYLFSESNILSRRYELPTCLLEIWTERSPLSEWQSQIVAQNLRFRLRLFDSKRVIKGNQQQITNLIEAVTNYCDRWLAQDDFDDLDHAIAIPELSKLKLSTLQLFDLYESLELCANELMILPNVVLEVRRLTPNWLKVIAAAIAIVGIGFGTIRLVSREQPSFQIASTPAASPPNQLPPEILERKSENKSESSAKIAASPKSSIQPNLSSSDTKPNSANSIPSKPSQSLNQKSPNRQSPIGEGKDRESSDKVAIARAPISGVAGNSSSDRQRENNNSPSRSDAMSDGMTTRSSQPSTRLEQSRKDATSQLPAEASKPSPATPSVSIPSSASGSANEGMVTNNVKVNAKVLQIQSNLPSDVNTDLVRYIQSQVITQSISKSTSVEIALEFEISGDRIRNISINNLNNQDSALLDSSAIAQLETIMLKWRSPNSVTGKIRLLLQI